MGVAVLMMLPSCVKAPSAIPSAQEMSRSKKRSAPRSWCWDRTDVTDPDTGLEYRYYERRAIRQPVPRDPWPRSKASKGGRSLIPHDVRVREAIVGTLGKQNIPK